MRESRETAGDPFAWVGPAVMGFLSGMFAAIATGAYSDPSIGPSAAAGFAVVTAGAAVFLGVLSTDG